MGEYRLTWVNVDELPALVGEQEGVMIEFLGGLISVRIDGTCNYSHTYNLTDVEESEEPRTVTDEEACTWTLTPDALHLRFTDGSSLSGFFSRDALYFDYVFPDGVFRFVYERVVT